MTQAQQDQKTAAERLNEGFQGLRQMESNREQRRKQLEDRINEIDRELSILANSREASELVGDTKAADKSKAKADELKKEKAELSDKLNLFQPQDPKEIYRKFQEIEGQHKTYARQVDESGLEILNDLQDKLDAKQQELQALAADYRQKVDELRHLSHEAGNMTETVQFARRFLRKDERIPGNNHRFRANNVGSNWEITGESLKSLEPRNHVND
jgi:hypothetical protein